MYCRSYLFELINHLFELARDRERGMNIALVNLRLRVSLQAMRLGYLKNSDVTPSLQRNITLQVSSLAKLFY